MLVLTWVVSTAEYLVVREVRFRQAGGKCRHAGFGPSVALSFGATPLQLLLFPWRVTPATPILGTCLLRQQCAPAPLRAHYNHSDREHGYES